MILENKKQQKLTCTFPIKNFFRIYRLRSVMNVTCSEKGYLLRELAKGKASIGQKKENLKACQVYVKTGRRSRKYKVFSKWTQMVEHRSE